MEFNRIGSTTAPVFIGKGIELSDEQIWMEYAKIGGIAQAIITASAMLSKTNVNTEGASGFADSMLAEHKKRWGRE